MSAPMNATMMTSGPTAFCMPGPDSDFEDDFVESSVFFAIQNPHSTVSEFAWPALGN